MEVTQQYSLSPIIQSIDFDSLRAICPDQYIDQIALYGWKHCHYEKLKNFPLTDHKSFTKPCPIKKIFDWKVGSLRLNPIFQEESHTLEGRTIEKIEVDRCLNDPLVYQEDEYSPKELSDWCKAGLVNIVFENFKRAKEKIPLIPIIFVIDVNNNPYPSTPSTVCSKEPQANTRVTHTELRRAYRLCKELPKELQEISIIANRTFIFTKIYIDSSHRARFEKVDPLWSYADWDNEWQKRESYKKDFQGLDQRNKTEWRVELTRRFYDYLSSFPRLNGSIVDEKEK